MRTPHELPALRRVIFDVDGRLVDSNDRKNLGVDDLLEGHPSTLSGTLNGRELREHGAIAAFRDIAELVERCNDSPFAHAIANPVPSQ